MDWSFWDFLWTAIVVYFWFAIIWMFVGAIGDIFRRNDLSGAAKAGWMLFLVVLPFLGILIYMATRPTMTEQDREIAAETQGQGGRVNGLSNR